jgi:hypothetical protein
MGSGRMSATKGKKKDYAETDESGQFFRSTMLDMPTRLRVAHGIGKTETDASIQVFQTLQQQGHPDAPPPFVSDGWGGIREAVIEVYGTVPEYGGKGRPPTQKRPQPGWQYLQVIKHRDAKGHVTGRTLKVIFGDETEVLEQLGHHTAYVERTHLTMRHFSGRLVRKGLGFSKDLEMHKASAVLEDVYYNLVRPCKSLRQARHDETGRRWTPRTPAMAAKMTDHVWTLKEAFSIIGVVNNS